jgi:hypothetical protein
MNKKKAIAAALFCIMLVLKGGAMDIIEADYDVVSKDVHEKMRVLVNCRAISKEEVEKIETCDMDWFSEREKRLLLFCGYLGRGGDAYSGLISLPPRQRAEAAAILAMYYWDKTSNRMGKEPGSIKNIKMAGHCAFLLYGPSQLWKLLEDDNVEKTVISYRSMVILFQEICCINCDNNIPAINIFAYKKAIDCAGDKDYIRKYDEAIISIGKRILPHWSSDDYLVDPGASAESLMGAALNQNCIGLISHAMCNEEFKKSLSDMDDAYDGLVKQYLRACLCKIGCVQLF